MKRNALLIWQVVGLDSLEFYYFGSISAADLNLLVQANGKFIHDEQEDAAIREVNSLLDDKWKDKKEEKSPLIVYDEEDAITDVFHCGFMM